MIFQQDLPKRDHRFAPTLIEPVAEHDEFLNPAFSLSRLETYRGRRAILNALRGETPNFSGVLLDVGCGRMPYRSLLSNPPSGVKTYLGLDLHAGLRYKTYRQYDPPDLEWNGQVIPLSDHTVDCAICTEVYELCPDIPAVMRETARVLKPGGFLFFTTPFLWPLFDSPADQGRPSPFALERHLMASGFEDIRMRSLGGWDASLATMIALWARRRPMKRWKRFIISVVTSPLVSLLWHWDAPPPVHTDQTMITHIAGTARRRALS
jgi:SAM-dependent methyltransferase